ncbi:6,7-dimethyl-8-ribityllumazine synthase [Candidatus Woesearchaeota archaeon]|nr:6,7-dimethyl-8-ribityllumazine synthase [Candidatus Woesearchaeota archaeon]
MRLQTELKSKVQLKEPTSIKIGIVVSQWYWDEITSKMLDSALKTATEHNVQTEVMKVPGSWEIMFGSKQLLMRKDIAGVVTLGALIEGDTDHDKLIAYTVASKIADLSLQYNKPVSLGVTGPKMSFRQAKKRTDKGTEAMLACLELLGK